MSYNYGNNPPQYPAPNNQIYPQIYNPANAPPPSAMSYPGSPPYQPPPPTGFTQPNQPPYAPSYPYPGQPGHAAPPMSYPGANPTAPGFGFPNAPQQSSFGVEWIPCTPKNASRFSDRAVVGGYEGYDNSPLWVIRAHFEGDLIPGKLAVNHNAAYVPWGGKENAVENIELCCAPPDRVRWVMSSYGTIPQGAIVAGHTSSSEPLYIGRAKQQGSLTPGKVHPSHKSMYISFAGKEIPHKDYEILVAV